VRPLDGHTLLWVTSANAWNATLYANLKFDFIRDFACEVWKEAKTNIASNKRNACTETKGDALQDYWKELQRQSLNH
jgi:hypothetical protein